jgi:penicillin V acylase-like amidase (Ntn superfamily)
MVYEEKITNATGTIEVAKYATFRVRAVAALTVTIDGVLAASMAINEVMVFNAGFGTPTDSKETVTITIAAGAGYVQVARDSDRRTY